MEKTVFYSDDNRIEYVSEFRVEKIEDDIWVISGDLGSSLKKQCETVTDNIPYNATVFLDSNGGSIETGMCIARTLYDKHVDTVVQHPQICNSACVWMFLAGDDRTLIGDVHFGIHSPGFPFHYISTNYPPYLVHVAVGAGYALHDMMDYINVDEELAELISTWVPNYRIHVFDYRDFDGDPEVPDILLLKKIATRYVDFWEYSN